MEESRPQSDSSFLFALIHIIVIPVLEVTVEIARAAENHLAGVVRFGPAGTPGGLFLAVRQNDGWQVVCDGNGSVDCPALRRAYGFTDDILEGFCD